MGVRQLLQKFLATKNIRRANRPTIGHLSILKNNDFISDEAGVRWMFLRVNKNFAKYMFSKCLSRCQGRLPRGRQRLRSTSNIYRFNLTRARFVQETPRCTDYGGEKKGSKRCQGGTDEIFMSIAKQLS